MPLLLYLLALAVFAQGTSEFVLAGLLPEIAGDLGVSLGQAGLLTSAFALGMVIGAPTMAALGRRLSPRRALTGFLALFIVVHIAGALTGDFAVLVGTRIVAALANAGFLAVALSTVTRLVPAERRARALSVILGGTTLALIAGVPAGAFVGAVLDWRVTLWAIAAVCLPALVAVLAAPTARLAEAASLGRELAALRERPLQLHIALAVLVNAATFCSYTYLAALTDTAVPALLGVFGVGAFLGVTAAGRFGDAQWRRVITLTGPLLLLGWALLAAGAGSPVALWTLALIQGGLSFALGSTLIARIMATARRAPTMGGAFATVALNLGAIAGPIAGGVALDQAGARGPLLISAALMLSAVTLWSAPRGRRALATRSARAPARGRPSGPR